MSGRPVTAFAAGAATVVFALVAKPRADDRARPLLFAALGTAAALAARAPWGLRGPQLGAGLRLGAVSVAAVVAVVALGGAIPAVREAMVARRTLMPTWHWLAVRIPLGSAWAEEVLFRGALTAVAVDALGPHRGRLLVAVVFGLWHVPDARSAGDPMLGTVAATAVAGAAFGELARRSGSLAAPLLAHLAVNEAGAVATLLARRAIRGNSSAVSAGELPRNDAR